MQWLDDFVTFLEERGDGERTIRAYRGDVEQYAVWYEQEYGEAFGPGKLTGIDVRRYLRHLQVGRKLKPATINRRNTALRALVVFGLAKGMIFAEMEGEILAGADYLEVADQGPKWMEKQELNKLMATYQRAINHELIEGREARYRQAVQQFAVMMVLYGGGLRVNEGLGLDLDDLVLGERKGKVVVRAGKGGSMRSSCCRWRRCGRFLAGWNCAVMILVLYSFRRRGIG